MARQRYAGYEQARSAGDLDGTPDIRIGLAMSGFSFTADAVNLADGTLDTFDGTGYADYDCAGVAVAYDSGDDEWQITADSGDGDEFGATVAAGSEPPTTLYVYLYVDGTAANDIILASSDDGTFADGNGGPMGLTLPNDVVLFSGNAA